MHKWMSSVYAQNQGERGVKEDLHGGRELSDKGADGPVLYVLR